MATKKNFERLLNHPDLSNSFNTLVANIRFASVDKQIKTIAIVASGENEGKSVCASNLGLAFSNAGKKVLLIDNDLRRRSLARILQTHPKFGIFSVLTGKSHINEAITRTNYNNLFFLDCEPNIANPVALLSTNRYALLLDYLHDVFDYVIIDTPPLNAFVDGALIAALADASIIAVRQNETKKSALTSAVQQLQKANANILGTVITFSKDAANDNYYYAYYNSDDKRVKKERKVAEMPMVSDDQAQMNVDFWLNRKNSGQAAKRQRSMGNLVSIEDNKDGEANNAAAQENNVAQVSNSSDEQNNDSNTQNANTDAVTQAPGTTTSFQKIQTDSHQQVYAQQQQQQQQNKANARHGK